VLQTIFEALGYTRQEDLYFEDKQLQAFWMQPPVTPHALATTISPKVFISELIPDRFSETFQHTLNRYTHTLHADIRPRLKELVEQLPASATQLQREIVTFLQCRMWQTPTYADYQILLRESEYAAWTLAFGNRINHFTVSVYLMPKFASLQQFYEYLTEQLQIPMNTQGGVIKGSPACGLEQCATLATKVPVSFQEGIHLLPYAFVEFAFRHPLPEQTADGLWHSYYQGFVVANADKIFESTFTSQTMKTEM
jgi:hypothetical protein